MLKIIFFANTDWYLYNFRLTLAKALRQQGAEIIFVSPHGQYVERLLSEGFRWHAVSMQRRSLNPFRELKVIYTLTSLYKHEKPDLTHNFTLKAVIYGTVAAKLARLKGCVNAITGMGYVFSSRKPLALALKPIIKAILRVILRMPRTILILQNPDDIVTLISNKIISQDKVRLIRGSGVNTSLFRPVCKRSREHNAYFKVIMSTRLLREKGIYEYIEAVRILLKKKSAKVIFYIAGRPDQGNPNSVSFKEITEWELSGLIKYLGHVEKMSELLAEMDCIVLPTFYGEGVPRILIEGASCGLPIVATDVPGCREIVKHNVNGILVPARNSFALAEAIKCIMDSPSEREIMGKAGRLLVIDQFDERLVINNTIKVYLELLPKFKKMTLSRAS